MGLKRGMERVLQPRRLAADRGVERLERSIRAILERRRRGLASAAGKLEALSPLATLRRGYAVPLDLEGHVLRSVRDFQPAGPFVLRVVDGRVRCEVVETRADREESDGRG